MAAGLSNLCGAVAQLGECLTGSQEVASSILASSTNQINDLASSSLLCPLHFSPTFAEHLPIPYRESFGNTLKAVELGKFPRRRLLGSIRVSLVRFARFTAIGMAFLAAKLIVGNSTFPTDLYILPFKQNY